MSLMSDIATWLQNTAINPIITRLNLTSKIQYKGYFLQNQTVIFYDDATYRVYYDGVDRYIKVLNKIAGTQIVGWISVRQAAQTVETVFLSTTTANSTSFVTSNNAAIAQYQLNPLVTNANFRLGVGDTASAANPADKMIFGTVTRMGATRVSATIYIQ
jgi:hypothetical protein